MKPYKYCFEKRGWLSFMSSLFCSWYCDVWSSCKMRSCMLGFFLAPRLSTCLGRGRGKRKKSAGQSCLEWKRRSAEWVWLMKKLGGLQVLCFVFLNLPDGCIFWTYQVLWTMYSKWRWVETLHSQWSAIESLSNRRRGVHPKQVPNRFFPLARWGRSIRRTMKHTGWWSAPLFSLWDVWAICKPDGSDRSGWQQTSSHTSSFGFKSYVYREYIFSRCWALTIEEFASQEEIQHLVDNWRIINLFQISRLVLLRHKAWQIAETTLHHVLCMSRNPIFITSAASTVSFH